MESLVASRWAGDGNDGVLHPSSPGCLELSLNSDDAEHGERSARPRRALRGGGLCHVPRGGHVAFPSPDEKKKEAQWTADIGEAGLLVVMQNPKSSEAEG